MSVFEIDDHQRRLLNLSASGLTDREIAVETFRSLRTVERVMGQLMTRIGAGNRVALGAYAMHHGWIDSAVLMPRDRRMPVRPTVRRTGETARP